MNPVRETFRRSSTKNLVFYILYLMIIAVIFVAIAEGFLRHRLVKPWRKPDVLIQVDPGGKFFMAHPTLGYTHIPGNFKVALPDGYSFNVTHLPNTLRITRPIGVDYGLQKRGEIWIFGCSFTHGWSINDQETFPWLLQERFTEYEFVNFGVSGYGTIHSLLQMQDALKTRTPKIVLLAYANIHDERNTFSRNRRKAVAPFNKLGPLVQPYARLNGGNNLVFSLAKVEYLEFPMMRDSALVHFIERKYNKLELKLHRSHAVSELLVKEMVSLAKNHQVKFFVANINSGQTMLDFAAKNGIANIDITVDLELPENNNSPHDGHPSAHANRTYADKLGQLLRLELSEKNDSDYRMKTTES